MKVDSIKELPYEIKSTWSNIDPYGQLPVEPLKKVIDWIGSNSDKKGYILVQ